MEGDILENENMINDKPRPVFLLVLCILSFIYIAYCTLVYSLQLINGPMSSEMMMEQRVKMTEQMQQMEEMGADYGVTLIKQIISMMESLNSNATLVSVVSLSVLALGFIGVLLMFKGRKIGFHLYIIYSLLVISKIYFFVSSIYIPFPYLMIYVFFGGLFVFMYSRNLYWLK